MEFLTQLGITDLYKYIVLTTAIILLPGPNSMYVLTTAAQQGVRRGYAAACGVFIGDTVLMVAAVVGAAALLKQFPAAFTALKVTGALYLSYLGIQMLIGAYKIWQNRAQLTADAMLKAATQLDASEQTSLTTPEGLHPFKRALLISLINPKAILFILSFFLQFVVFNPEQPSNAYWAYFILGAILQVFSFVYLSALIFAGSSLASAFRSRPMWMVSGTAAVGCLFIGFGIRLATATMS